ncbi:MAG: cryptochrome/photolyase family protein [Phycisphaerales bacterium JB040]
MSSRAESTRTLGLILGDQLDPTYPEALGLDRGRDRLLMVEVARASERPASHVQRTVLFLSAMRHHAVTLRDDGWEVDYVNLTDPDNTQRFHGEIERAVGRHSPDEIAVLRPGSHALRGELESACGKAGVALRVEEDPHFLCSVDEFSEWAEGRKQLTMEYFYRSMRTRYGVLVDSEGEPEGGRWNLDKENRRTFKSAPSAPSAATFEPDDVVQRVMEDVREALPGLPGELESFAWPVTREQATRAMGSFLQHRLPDFGTYQDAMWRGERTLFHSFLSTSLNLKLLRPMEAIEGAVRAYGQGRAPLNSVEGFVRQILGWREFIRGVYFHEGPGYEARNGLGHTGSLPEFYWTSETDMACMADALGGVVEHAYGHHIERLMVYGNFALIAGLDPAAVHAWYLGMFADGIDWVTAPNTIGMALHADGGVVGTKPYAASGKYIKRMSNHCKGCHYDVNARAGANACPFNVLYWDFLMRHEDRFSSNTRMAMILKNLERMAPGERAQITREGEAIRRRYGIA